MQLFYFSLNFSVVAFFRFQEFFLIGQLLFYVTQSWVVVTKKGRPTAVMLPYFDDNEEAVADYLEEYEMNRNRDALKERYKKSKESGPSSLVL